MAKKKKKGTPTNMDKNAVACTEELLFLYPEFKQANTPLTALIRYKNDMEVIRDKVKTSEHWDDQKKCECVLEKIKKNIKYKKKNLEEFKNRVDVTELRNQIQYLEEIVKKWDMNIYYNFIQDMYSRAIKILERYLSAYDDILSRQSLVSGKQFKMIYVIKSIAEPVAKRTNVKVSYSDRLKSWYSTVQKLITRMESMDPFELDSFYDIFGTQFVLMDNDEKQAEQNCYALANSLFYVLKDLPNRSEEIKCKVVSVEFLVPRYVGPVSKQMEEEYAVYVKDYIKNPKKTGYAALHICCKVNMESHGKIVSFYFETQITTSRKKRAANNEKLHDLYKKNSKLEIGWDLSAVKFGDEFDFVSHDDYIDEVGFIKPILLTKPKKFVPLN